MPNYRGGRINEEVKKEVSDIIRNSIKDPRLTAMISVTDAVVTKDLRYANIYISIFSLSEEEKASTFSALKSSSSFVRKELGHRINLRHTPEVLFQLDESIEKGMHIDSLLEKIKEK
ncbi:MULTISPECIES: 30S ribosome-binding factor RbfA [Clostridium]|uniref:Ribosome-binding factor A n=2 Tax=Clostridium TaxID=1485 RepID=A0A9W6D9V7_9CLOT|nr:MULTISPECIES: 30S ribosome-binding factor RbfA [Clostridium]MBK1810667.1 30S ribosome-binding factor RbfA [Clostridium yunnanense]GKU24750.1 ribosome-binding factor A [Clostridium folliculivorans]GKU30848.1 ribosome-binding factor A [Clostridium folliculivorans]